MAEEKQCIDLGLEDGVISVAFAGVEVRADLWELHDAFVGCFQRCEGKPDADLTGELRQEAIKAGLPEMSSRVVFRLWQRLKEEVARAKKKDIDGASLSDGITSTPES